MLKIILVLLLVPGSLNGKPTRKQTFLDVTTLSVCNILEKSKFGVMGSGRYAIKKKNNKWIRQNFLNTNYIYNIIKCTYEAAGQDPSKGGREEATLKFVAAFYGESGFNQYAVNSTLNKDGSIDQGLVQRNMKYDNQYTEYCNKNGFKYSDYCSEIHFAVYWDSLIKWSYKFQCPKNKELTFFYNSLRKDVSAAMRERGYND